jgi:hypothetical protein
VLIGAEGEPQLALDYERELLGRMSVRVFSASTSRTERDQQHLEPRAGGAQHLDLGIRPPAAQGLPVGDPDDEPSFSAGHPGEELAEGEPDGARDLLHRADGRGDLPVLDLRHEAGREAGLPQHPQGHAHLQPGSTDVLADQVLLETLGHAGGSLARTAHRCPGIPRLGARRVRRRMVRVYSSAVHLIVTMKRAATAIAFAWRAVLRRPTGRGSWLAAFLLVAGSSAFALLAVVGAEKGARWLAPDYLVETRGLHVFSETLGWKPRAGASAVIGGKRVTINAQGYV